MLGRHGEAGGGRCGRHHRMMALTDFSVNRRHAGTVVHRGRRLSYRRRQSLSLSLSFVVVVVVDLPCRQVTSVLFPIGR